MLRHIFLCLAFAFSAETSAAETATATQQVQSITGIRDPAAFAASQATLIANEGMPAILDAFAWYGQVNPTDAGLLQLNQIIGSREARSTTKIEDVSLSGVMRSIYYLLVFDERTFLFVRYDFIATGGGNWTAANFKVGTTWNYVAETYSPGFVSSPLTQ